MKSRPIAIILGGTNPHIALIQNLKQRGFYTILIDYTNNPPAKFYADKHIQESTLDKELVVRIATEHNAQVVISCCIDHANAIACYAAERLGLPQPYSYETALNVTDKCLMKHIMQTNYIPTSKHISLQKYRDIESEGLQYPLVVKPSDSTGSKGVRKANNIEELETYFASALELSRNKNVIIEEFVEGFEIQIDCFIKNNIAKVIMIRKKNHVRLDGDFAMQTVGSSIPPELSTDILQDIEQAANKIASSFKLNNSPLFIQAIVDKNEKIKVVEFAPRVGGGLSYRLIMLYSGFDFLNATVESFLNIDSTINIKKSNILLESVIVYAKEGVFEKTVGSEELLKHEIIEEFFEFSTKGMQIGTDMSTRSRVCAFIVKGETRHEIQNKVQEAIEKLQIYDNNGNSIMRKELYNRI